MATDRRPYRDRGTQSSRQILRQKPEPPRRWPNLAPPEPIPTDPAEHAADFAARWVDQLENFVEGRMHALNVPEHQIGASDHKNRVAWRTFFPDEGTGGSNGPGGRINVDAGVLNLDVRFVIRPPASTALDKPRGLWDLVDVVTENNLIRAIVTWMSPMPFPFAETVALTDLQRAQLESLVRAGSTPQALVFRCRLILRAADRDHPTNLQIAAEFDCNRHTVAGWRNRYLSNGLAGLQDASPSGRPRRFSPSERLDLINLARAQPNSKVVPPPVGRWMTSLPP